MSGASSKVSAKNKAAEGEAAGKASASSASKDTAGGSATTTRDLEVIKAWAEARGGRPSVVKDSGGGILRLDFAEPDDSLAEVPWEDFFRIFDESNLAFLHQDTTSGGELSRFNKFVAAEGAGEAKPMKTSSASASKPRETAPARTKKAGKSSTTSAPATKPAKSSASAMTAPAKRSTKKGGVANGAAKD